MLNAFQKKLAAWALTCLSLIVLASFLVAVTLMMKAFLAKFGVVIWPIAAALAASFLLRPVVDFLSERARISKTLACAVTFAGLVAVLALAAVFVLPALFSEIGAMLSSLPDAFQNLVHRAAENFPGAREFIASKIQPLKDYAAAHLNLESVVSALRGALDTAISATGGVIALCSFVAAFAVAPIYLFYMLSADFDFYGFLERRLAFADKSIRDDIVFCVKNFEDIMTSFFRGQMLIALIMGTLMGAGLSICGVRFGFLLGFCAGMGNLIPYLGTILGLGSVLPVAFFQQGGGLWLAILSLGVFILVQILEGYVLTPKIMGRRTGLHPAVIIFSVFFWGIALNGFLGMILAIPLSAFVVVLWRRFAEGRSLS